MKKLKTLKDLKRIQMQTLPVKAGDRIGPCDIVGNQEVADMINEAFRSFGEQGFVSVKDLKRWAIGLIKAYNGNRPFKFWEDGAILLDANLTERSGGVIEFLYWAFNLTEEDLK